jgi:hypothetical protein
MQMDATRSESRLGDGAIRTYNAWTGAEQQVLKGHCATKVKPRNKVGAP